MKIFTGKNSTRAAASVVAGLLTAGLCAAGNATVAQAAELPPGSSRVGVLSNSGDVHVKEGTLLSSWVEKMSTGVVAFEVAGDRVGVLDTGGKLWVKEGNLWTGWSEQADNVKDFRLAGNRIGIVRTDGTAAVKEGGLQAGWSEQANGVREVEITPDRIGIVGTDGTVNVKQGGLGAGWVPQIGGVADLELSGDRVGVLRTDGTVAVKESNLWSDWVEQTNGVTDLELSGSLIGVVLANGLATVKEGNLYSAWVNQLGDAEDIEISGDRIGVVRANGSAVVKDGGVYGAWVEQTSGVKQLRLATATPASAAGHVTIDDITAIYGSAYATDTVAAGLPGLNEVMTQKGITTPTRKAAFLATLKHESGFRYNAGEAGNIAVYRGRGFIQLTGQYNYQSAGASLGHDFLNNPSDAASLQWSAKVAGWYWTVARNINAAADAYDMGAVGRAIGYSYALDPTESNNRCASYKRALAHFNGGSLPVPETAIDCTR
ncbi:putative chitinase [Saccharothrix ecbatanensis]|uniref:Putative chitinase n=1 Tax=Saccharothrix ecbatanensis TaxID=1105145 RepID=A0A7W9HTX6_9PSEU|nr:glycoside hydrolase family 19 protein [Saccharothrix ecbatanensis]MBB5808175.1 putative chitinase [Saccharothrix ecbatanensis]